MPSELFKLSDGAIFYKADLPPVAMLRERGLEIIGSRKSYTEKVKWQKQTAFEVLEEKDLPGRWIPLFPVFWTRVRVDSQLLCYGMVKDAMDPAADLRGRGRSAWDPDASHYQLPTYVQDVWSLLDSRQVNRVLVVGTSLGALIGMTMGKRLTTRPSRRRGC